MRIFALPEISVTLLALTSVCGGEIAELVVDCSKPVGVIRPLHSSNGGPIAWGGMVDLSERHRELGFPYLRLHDCQWPEPAVVDVHTIFRDFRDDPSDPASYYFARTDDYLDALLKTGAKVVYRLGESIEHTRRKYDVHPPRDYDKWAAVCVGIIRHYNEGWAEGFRHGINYWEIWNEPDVRPQMWSGTDEDYYRLYAVTARAIKARFPDVKVGGPAVGHAGDFKDGRFEPSPFVARFLDYVKVHAVPLDFFSWHRYTDNPTELAERTRGVRQMLDRAGFARTESHLNEWNYLPRNDWNVFSSGTPTERAQWYAEMAGPAGAAFTACALLELQDAPLDMACFYTSGTGGFGLFSELGQPNKTFFALKAFRRLLETPQRLAVQGGQPGRLSAAAGINETKTALMVLVSNFKADDGTIRLSIRGCPRHGAVRYDIIRVGSEDDWSPGEPGEARASSEGFLSLTAPLKAPSLCLIRLELPVRRAQEDGL